MPSNDPQTRPPSEAVTGIAAWSEWRRCLFSKMACWRFLILFLAAALAGLVALYFRQADIFGTHFFLTLYRDDSFAGMALPKGWGIWLAAAIVIITMMLIIWLRDRFFPGTEGTGIPQAIACLKVKDSPFRRHMLSVRIAIGKTLLLTMAFFGGMTVGREGPSVHVGACLMYLATKICKLPQHLVQRGLILAGGGAGIAAAFNAPIAGMIFAFEEIGRSFEKDNASIIVRTVIIASLVVIVGLGWDYLFYGEVYREFGFDAMHWLCVIFIGIIGGFLGGLFARSVVWGTRLAARGFSRNRIRTAALIGISLAAIGMLSQGQSFGSGYAQAKAVLMYRNTDYYQTLGIEQTASMEAITAAYEQLAHQQTLLGKHGHVLESARVLEDAYKTLSDPETRHFYDQWVVPGPLPWWYAPAKAGGSYMSLISGIPGGLFDPSLSVGAGLGDLCADVCHDLFNGIHPQFVIMLFMVAYFAGVVQSPITVFVIMIEMTDARFATLPLMATAVIAYSCSSLVCTTSIYEALAEIFLRAVRQRSKEPIEMA